jgi:hypothetical protein
MFRTLLERLIEADCCFALFSILMVAYYGTKMSGEIVEGWRGGVPCYFPLFLEDDELKSAEGRRFRDLFHRWIVIFLGCAVSGMLLIYLYHR